LRVGGGESAPAVEERRTWLRQRKTPTSKMNEANSVVTGAIKYEIFNGKRAEHKPAEQSRTNLRIRGKRKEGVPEKYAPLACHQVRGELPAKGRLETLGLIAVLFHNAPKRAAGRHQCNTPVPKQM